MWKPFYLFDDGIAADEASKLEEMITDEVGNNKWLSVHTPSTLKPVLAHRKRLLAEADIHRRVDAIGHKAVIQRMVEIHGPITSLPPIWLVEMAVLSLETRLPNPKPDHSP